MGLFDKMKDAQSQAQEAMASNPGMAQQAHGMGGDMSGQAAYAQMAQKLHASGVEAPGVSTRSARPATPTSAAARRSSSTSRSSRPTGDPYQTTIKQSMLPAQMEGISEGAGDHRQVRPRLAHLGAHLRLVATERKDRMGFFKGMRDLKGISDHHGGMPSIRQCVQGHRRAGGRPRRARGDEKGTPAKAVAKGFAEPVPGDRFAMQILLEVHPPSGERLRVDYVFPTTRMKAAITVGMEIPVKIHPEDPQRIAVQWDAQQASIAAAGGDMAAVIGGMQAHLRQRGRPGDARRAGQRRRPRTPPEAEEARRRCATPG